MQFNIIFKTIFENIHKKFRFVHTNTFCKYRKKLRASPRVHLVCMLMTLPSFSDAGVKSSTKMNKICPELNIAMGRDATKGTLRRENQN